MAKRTPSKPSKISPEQVSLVETAVFECVESLLPENFYLLDAEFVEEAGHWYVRLYIEGRGFRVSLNDCQAVSLAVDEKIDALPALRDLSYTLEVSSPGAFRALSKAREFEFYQGARVKVQGAPGSKLPFKPAEGVLTAYDAETQTLTLKTGDEEQTVTLNANRAAYLNPDLKIPEEASSSPVVLSKERLNPVLEDIEHD